MQEILRYDRNSLFYIEEWMDINKNLKVGITSRNGGVSTPPFESNNMGLHVSDNYVDVLENRKQLSKTVQIPLENWVSGEQVHQTAIHVVHRDDAGKGATELDTAIKGVDGLITNEKGLLCTAFFADCVPLFFFDPITEYVGIAHAGWKGSVGRIAEAMVLKFVELGSNKRDLLVAIGPSISKENYEVDHYVTKHIPPDLQEKVLTPIDQEHYFLDLKQLNVEILVQSGVFRSNIDVTKYCTFREKDFFFSHRRDQGKTGRMLGFIGFSC